MNSVFSKVLQMWALRSVGMGIMIRSFKPVQLTFDVLLSRSPDNRLDDTGGGHHQGDADTDSRVPGDRGDNL
jgi:hypothetical protein